MLTEAEKEWLAKRDITCRRCEFGDDCQLSPRKKCDMFRPKEMWEDHISAAIFEARVAAKLAEYCADYWQRQSAWHALKDARLSIEAEMEK